MFVFVINTTAAKPVIIHRWPVPPTASPARTIGRNANANVIVCVWDCAEHGGRLVFWDQIRDEHQPTFHQRYLWRRQRSEWSLFKGQRSNQRWSGLPRIQRF